MSRQYLLRANGKTYGPFSSRQVRELASAGKLTASTEICEQGLTVWKLCTSVKSLSPELAASSKNQVACHVTSDIAVPSAPQKSVGISTEGKVLRVRSHARWLAVIALVVVPGIALGVAVSVRQSEVPSTEAGLLRSTTPSVVASQSRTQRHKTELPTATTIGTNEPVAKPSENSGDSGQVTSYDSWEVVAGPTIRFADDDFATAESCVYFDGKVDENCEGVLRFDGSTIRPVVPQKAGLYLRPLAASNGAVLCTFNDHRTGTEPWVLSGNSLRQLGDLAIGQWNNAPDGSLSADPAIAAYGNMYFSAFPSASDCDIYVYDGITIRTLWKSREDAVPIGKISAGSSHLIPWNDGLAFGAEMWEPTAGQFRTVFFSVTSDGTASPIGIQHIADVPEACQSLMHATALGSTIVSCANPEFGEPGYFWAIDENGYRKLSPKISAYQPFPNWTQVGNRLFFLAQEHNENGPDKAASKSEGVIYCFDGRSIVERISCTKTYAGGATITGLASVDDWLFYKSKSLSSDANEEASDLWAYCPARSLRIHVYSSDGKDKLGQVAGMASCGEYLFMAARRWGSTVLCAVVPKGLSDGRTNEITDGFRRVRVVKEPIVPLHAIVTNSDYDNLRQDMWREVRASIGDEYSPYSIKGLSTFVAIVCVECMSCLLDGGLSRDERQEMIRWAIHQQWSERGWLASATTADLDATGERLTPAEVTRLEGRYLIDDLIYAQNLEGMSAAAREEKVEIRLSSEVVWPCTVREFRTELARLRRDGPRDYDVRTTVARRTASAQTMESGSGREGSGSASQDAFDSQAAATSGSVEWVTLGELWNRLKSKLPASSKGERAPPTEATETDASNLPTDQSRPSSTNQTAVSQTVMVNGVVLYRKGEHGLEKHPGREMKLQVVALFPPQTSDYVFTDTFGRFRRRMYVGDWYEIWIDSKKVWTGKIAADSQIKIVIQE